MNIKQLLDEMNLSLDFIGVDNVSDYNDKSQFILDGSKMLDKEAALVEIYTQLRLTDYLPYANYDGLDELLRPDLWPELKTMSLQVTNTENFLIKGDKGMISTLFGIFQEASTAWASAKGKRSFQIILR